MKLQIPLAHGTAVITLNNYWDTISSSHSYFTKLQFVKMSLTERQTVLTQIRQELSDLGLHSLHRQFCLSTEGCCRIMINISSDIVHSA